MVSLISESTIEKVARIVSEDHLALLTAQTIKSKIEAAQKPNINFATEVFTDLEMATLWLFE